jgi:hypothetical protein
MSVVHGIGYHQWELDPEEAKTALIVSSTSTHLISSVANTLAVRLHKRNPVRGCRGRAQSLARHILSSHSNCAMADSTHQVHHLGLCNIWLRLYLAGSLPVYSR